MQLQQLATKSYGLKSLPRNKLSLSTYFPIGTQFFYGYPVGEDSGFLGLGSTVIQEIITGRVFGCAGEGVSVICFPSVTQEAIPESFFDEFSIPYLDKTKIITLPASLHDIKDVDKRNEAIKISLSKLVKPGSLVMAQPYIDKSLEKLYRISPTLINWLNDKTNMRSYINNSLTPERLGTFSNGVELSKSYKEISLPAVIKVASSSSGDGVYICISESDLKHAADKLSKLKGTILAERYIEAVKNYGINFGVPYNKKLPIDIFGVNQQLTTSAGKYIGGIINSTDIPKTLDKAVRHLVEDILPYVREKGWYGVGGFDILLDAQNNPYFIDCNFRMTGMSAFHFLIANNEINKPIVNITCHYEGTLKDLRKKLYAFAGKESHDKFLQIIAINRHSNSWMFNAALTYENGQFKKRAQQLIDAGFKSYTLEHLVSAF